MNDTPYVSPYLNQPIPSKAERLAIDARAAGLSATASRDGILLNGLYVSTPEALASIIAIHNGVDIEEQRQAQARQEHSRAVERRAKRNAAWSYWANV